MSHNSKNKTKTNKIIHKYSGVTFKKRTSADSKQKIDAAGILKTASKLV